MLFKYQFQVLKSIDAEFVKMTKMPKLESVQIHFMVGWKLSRVFFSIQKIKLFKQLKRFKIHVDGAYLSKFSTSNFQVQHK